MSEQSKNDGVKPVEQSRNRIPLGSRNVLTAPKRPGFVRRIVNDIGDRVKMFQEAGYNIVNDGTDVGDPKIGKPTQLGSNTNPHVGSGQKAFLMEIPEEYYKEDQERKQKEISEVENQIKRKGKLFDERTSGKDGLSGNVEIQ